MMSIHVPRFAAIALALTVAVGAPRPWAAERTFTYDELEANDINRVCAACHGEYGQGGGGGVYPRLAGLSAKYLADQIQDFKNRKRVNMPMVPFANDRELSEEDVFNITTFLSKIELKTRLPEYPEGTDALVLLNEGKKVVQIPAYEGDVKAGKSSYRYDCALCHGKTGEGKGDKPPLVGQFSDYLLKQIEMFKSGERSHEERETTFAELSLEDARNILAYLATLDD